jgi:hypothetical protein
MAYDREYTPGPGERTHRAGAVEPSSGPHTRAPRPVPMWVWLLPLVLTAIVLSWYVFTRGEPHRPEIGRIPIERTERVIVDREAAPVIVVPEIEQNDPPIGSPDSAHSVAESQSQTPPSEPAAEQPATPP